MTYVVVHKSDPYTLLFWGNDYAWHQKESKAAQFDSYEEAEARAKKETKRWGLGVKDREPAFAISLPSEGTDP